MKVLAFGEILWDVFPDKKHLGGASLNFGAHLAKHGHDVYMLSALGQDELGTEALKQVRQWKLREDFITVWDNHPTGACIVTLDEQGLPSYDLKNHVAYDYIPGEVDGDFDVLYFGTLALRGDYNRASVKKLLAEKQFAHIFVDVNIRPPYQFPETTAIAAENATILKISDEELGVVAKLLDMQCLEPAAFAKALAAKYQNLQYVIITLGGDGAYTLDCKSGKEYTCPCEKVEVVSTVGAGDSFSAAFVHQLMSGADLSRCLKYASKVAGFVVSRQGAVPDYVPEQFA